MQRLYNTVISHHLVEDRQMIFLAGPRQVGKTTIGQSVQELTDKFIYLNWDFDEDKRLIIAGANSIIEKYNLLAVTAKKAIIVFDEIHKYSKWRDFLKGFYDKFNSVAHIIVTGSSSLDIYRHQGDSLMGRYFVYRVHPLSVAELLTTSIAKQEISPARALDFNIYLSLIKFAGFPEPFLKQNQSFYNRWVKLRVEQLFYADIRSLTRVQEIAQIKFLAEILKQHSGELINYNNLARIIKVSADTISAWLEVLYGFYYCYKISPWSKNISRSLLKQPKIYLWNWADAADIGLRNENFVASHLLKAIQLWEDMGFGKYELYFLRDKEQREVDFVVVKNGEPWFLVEVKSSDNSGINKNLYYFQAQTQAKHAFQIVIDAKYVDIDCFSYTTPVIVPAVTFLSQLV